MSKPLKTATGRRKTAIARVFILEGSGSITVNGRDFEEYFPTVALQNQILFPLALTNLLGKLVRQPSLCSRSRSTTHLTAGR